MVSMIGHRTIRNRGTVGGSLCHADPSAELPALALAADAEFLASSSAGTRVIPVADFNHGYLSTALDATEVLTEIRWALHSGRDVVGSAQFVRRSGDFAIAAVVVLLRLSAHGSVEKARVVAYGSLTRPMRLEAVEEALAEDPSSVSAREMAQVCRSLVQPSSDLHGGAEYKRQLFAVMCRRAIEDVVQQLRSEAA
jgi:carbon-monoxide dehydrogenase medium subunit